MVFTRLPISALFAGYLFPKDIFVLFFVPISPLVYGASIQHLLCKINKKDCQTYQLWTLEVVSEQNFLLLHFVLFWALKYQGHQKITIYFVTWGHLKSIHTLNRQFSKKLHLVLTKL